MQQGNLGKAVNVTSNAAANMANARQQQHSPNKTRTKHTLTSAMHNCTAIS
jgi:hypothetical protein